MQLSIIMRLIDFYDFTLLKIFFAKYALLVYFICILWFMHVLS